VKLAKPGLLVEVVYDDTDYQEIVLAADSGTFSGETTLLMATDEARIIAEQLVGFPSGPSDEREVSLRGMDTDCGVDLRLYCVGGAVQSWVDVRMRVGRESVALSFRVAPSSLDAFIARLRTIETSGSAILAAES